MVKTPWKPAVMALVLLLGLAGCGDDGEETAGGESEPEATAAEAPADGESAPAEEAVNGENEPQTATEEEEAAAEPSPDPAEAPADAPTGDPTTTTEGDAPPDDGAAQEAVPTGDMPEGEETIDPDAETLGESPTETLEEGGALPGEPTSSDIEAIIEETERRFEEAQRRLDEQFEEVEGESPTLEAMDDESMDFETELEPSSDLPEAGDSELDEQASRAGEPTSRDIDAIIEEQERRFEEAQRELQQQFEEAERRDPTEGLEELEVPEPADDD
ncbi:hypothetical protein [Halomonas sp. NO4]|uniref:hypothetical protein n=1 Tax=Halomonas sp. NO4 TaxID=2484813 RepID=UPI0013D4CA5B|nr:hypothetical protein [Halomonas sp. NO4]